jgi:hypothetical protein
MGAATRHRNKASLLPPRPSGRLRQNEVDGRCITWRQVTRCGTGSDDCAGIACSINRIRQGAGCSAPVVASCAVRTVDWKCPLSIEQMGIGAPPTAISYMRASRAARRYYPRGLSTWSRLDVGPPEIVRVGGACKADGSASEGNRRSQTRPDSHVFLTSLGGPSVARRRNQVSQRNRQRVSKLRGAHRLRMRASNHGFAFGEHEHAYSEFPFRG